VQALGNELPAGSVVAVLTQVIVDEADPAFAHPTKPIGPVYAETDARRLAREHGWTVARDGDAFRRVVPSPQPVEIVELHTIGDLVGEGHVVVCAGGGGIPVVVRESRLVGVEAVIDKDLTAALLAEALEADRLVLLTDVPFVERSWGTENAGRIEVATPSQLRSLHFASGSMGPKIEAVCRFVERTGREAMIGALSDLDAVVRGESGTRVARIAAALAP
jgi:carbamate kinase